MKVVKCRKCGCHRPAGHCKLCELLAEGVRAQAAKTQQTTTWPMKCEALAVHPHQVVEANERNRKHGVNVTYDRQGFAHIPDQAAYARVLKLEGLHNKSEGFHGA